MFKIVSVDNFNREHISDVLIIPRIESETTAITIRDLLNNDSARSPDRWHQVYPVDRPLHKFEP